MLPYNLHPDNKNRSSQSQSQLLRPYPSMNPLSDMKLQESQIPTNNPPNPSQAMNKSCEQDSPEREQHENHPVRLSKQLIEDLLTCQVCYCVSINPTMCPNCSKLFCDQCIKQCLQIKPQCPHCRKNVKSGNGMASCTRFINQMNAIFEKLIDQKMKEQLCPTHKQIPLNYYCQSCQEPVCCECQMFGQHKQHSLKPLIHIYQKYYEQLRSQLTEFKEMLKAKQVSIKEIEAEASQLRKVKDSQLAEIQQWSGVYRTKIAEGIEQEGRKVEDKLKELQAYEKELQMMEAEVRKQMDSAIEDGSFTMKAGLQGKVHQLLLKEVSNEKSRSEKSQQKCGEQHQTEKSQKSISGVNRVLEEVIPPYIENVYTVTDFSQKRRERSMVFSPVVKIEGTEWRLKVYPGGSESHPDGNSYLSIFIEMVSSLMPHSPTTYEYQIELIHPKKGSRGQGGKHRMLRQYSSTFEPGECWGYNKYIKIQTLLREGFVDEAKDQLTIKYYLRNPFYFNVYQQKELYIQALDNRILKQQQEIRQLESLLGQE